MPYRHKNYSKWAEYEQRNDVTNFNNKLKHEKSVHENGPKESAWRLNSGYRAKFLLKCSTKHEEINIF